VRVSRLGCRVAGRKTSAADARRWADHVAAVKDGFSLLINNMVTLYQGKGASEFRMLEPVLEQEAVNNLLFTASQLLVVRGEHEAVKTLASMEFRLNRGTNDFKDQFLVLHAPVAIDVYEHFRRLISTEGYFKPCVAIASVMEEMGYFVRFIVCELSPSAAPDNWQAQIHTPTNNQAIFSFKDSQRISYEGLNFRSKTEIKVFDALIKKGLLILPLPVAVMGSSKKYKEPDFVVCFKGKIGILEIHGDKWHPPETAAEEHERRREFTRLGVSVYEIFGAERCWNDPDGVVSDFIQALTRA